MDFRKIAEAALAERARLVDEVRSMNANASLSAAEKRERGERLSADIEAKTAEARAAIEAGEREAEIRDLTAKHPELFTPKGERRSEGEWRSLVPSASEWRAVIAEGVPGDGGYSVPVKVRNEAITLLRQKSVFLSAPGLNVIPFDSSDFVLPGLSAFSDAAVVAEGGTIAQGTQTFTGQSFKAIKYADLRKATNEILADSALPLRQVIQTEMVRTIGQKVDKDAFAAGNGTTALKGLTAAGQSTNTALSAGQTQVKWDAVVDAYAAVVASGATPTVVWCSADQYAGLLKEREAGATGAYLAGTVTTDPAKAALGLPLLVSGNLPVRTVMVADASRVFVGIRQDVQMKVSEDAFFADDEVGFRATYRVGGLVVAEATSVQRITAAAA